MNYMDQFVIPFSGLKTGNYQYDFNIDNKFFEYFDQSEIRQASLLIVVEMERQQRMLVFNFNITGTIVVPCDRCLAEFDQPVSGTERLIVKFGEEHGEETDEILIITEKEHSVNLGSFIYEYINLLIPYRHVHGEDAHGKSLCDPDVTRYIKEDETVETDPRWDALKLLKDKDKI